MKTQASAKPSAFQARRVLRAPASPLLATFFLPISNFLDRIISEDPSPSIDLSESFAEILGEVDRLIQKDTTINAATVDAKWRKFLSEIMFRVQTINSKNQPSQILQHIKNMKDVINQVKQAVPIATAAKKEHLMICTSMMKAISKIEQSAEINDRDRIAIQVRKFKNDLSHAFTKGFQLSTLDRATSLEALQVCKKNSDLILRKLLGTNQVMILPFEFREMSRFINELKIKAEFHIPTVNRRSKTPPARVPKQAYTRRESANFAAQYSKTKTLIHNNENTNIDAIKKSKAKQRSKTPPSKISNLMLNNKMKQKERLYKYNDTPSPRSAVSLNSPQKNYFQSNPKTTIKTSSKTTSNRAKLKSSFNQKSSLNSSAVNDSFSVAHSAILSPRSNLSKSTNASSSFVSTYSYSVASPKPSTKTTKSINSKASGSLKKSSKQQTQFPSTSQRPFYMDNSLTRSNKALSAKKKTNPSNKQQALSVETSNLVSTAVNLKNIISKSGSPMKRDSSFQSGDSETDQFVQTLTKITEQTKINSPILQKFHHDLNEDLLLTQDEFDNYKLEKDYRIDIRSNDENDSSGQSSSGNKFMKNGSDDIIDPQSSNKNNTYFYDTNSSKIMKTFQFNENSNINDVYEEFSDRLNRFNSLISTCESIDNFMFKIRKSTSKAIDLEEDLSMINESIARNQPYTNKNQKNNFKVGSILAQLNRQIDECLDFQVLNGEAILDTYNRLENVIFSSNSNESNKNFYQLKQNENAIIESLSNANQLIIDFVSKIPILENIKSLREENLKLSRKINALTSGLSNAQEIAQRITNTQIIDQSILNEIEQLSTSELILLRNELDEISKFNQKTQEEEISLLAQNYDSLHEKRSSLNKELRRIEKQRNEIHSSLMKCKNSKTVQYKFKIIPKENIYSILTELHNRENEIIQELISI